MGKASKKRRSDDRKKRKRASKEAKKAQYKAYAESGKTKVKASSGQQKSLKKHPQKPCGNPGCKECYPQFKRISTQVIESVTTQV